MADFICFFCEEKEAERYIKISKYHYYICESCRLDVTKAIKQSVQPDGCPICHGEKGAFLDGHWTECIACYGNL